MPINTIQIQKLLGKHTFQQLRYAVNDLIEIVNGLPSTVRGDITRQGGIIDGKATGVLPIIDPGQLFVLSADASWVGIGQFLGGSDPDPVGQIHINTKTDAHLNISQNSATGMSFMSLQASNTASDPQANNFGFLIAKSDTTTWGGVITLATANTDLEASSIYTQSQNTWGDTDDIGSPTRFTLFSDHTDAHGGPAAQLTAQLRIERALAHDTKTTNTAPLLSVRGYSSGWDGLGVNDTPVRISIGDRSTTEANRANTYAVIDFLNHGADTTAAEDVGAQISAEYTRDGLITTVAGPSAYGNRSSTLGFSVRSSDSANPIDKVMVIYPGSEVTGDTDKSTIVIANTIYHNSIMARDGSGNPLYSANAMHAQLSIQQSGEGGHASGGFERNGLLIRGHDHSQHDSAVPVFRLENPTATAIAGAPVGAEYSRKWETLIDSSGGYVIRTMPSNDWINNSTSANTQFRIIPGHSATYFRFGNSNSAGDGRDGASGVQLFLSGGHTGTGSLINFEANRSSVLADTGHPDRWRIQSTGDGSLAIYPLRAASAGGFENDATNIAPVESRFYFAKESGANAMFGIGLQNPTAQLHVRRTAETANVVIESDQSWGAKANGAQIMVQDSSGSNNYVVLNSVPPRDNGSTDADLTRGKESPAAIIASHDNDGTTYLQVQSQEIVRLSRRGSSRGVPFTTVGGHSLGAHISYRVQTGVDVSGANYDNNGNSWDAVRTGARVFDDRVHTRQAKYQGVGAGVASEDSAGYVIETASNKESRTTNFHLAPGGALGIGSLGVSPVDGLPYYPQGLVNPTFTLDLSTNDFDGGVTSNTMIAFSVPPEYTGSNAFHNSWVMGINNTFKGIAKSAQPFVIKTVETRSVGNPQGVDTGNVLARDGMFVFESGVSGAIQAYNIGIREEHNTLTIYTPANTTSTNWDSGVAAGRVGVANTFPAHMLTVNGYSAVHGGVGVYGQRATVRLIDNAPGSDATDGLAGAEQIAAGFDATGAGLIGAEKNFHIGAQSGSFYIAQNLGAETDFYDQGGNKTFNIVANTNLSSSAGTLHAVAYRRGFGADLDADRWQTGSVSINGNNHPMASGLFVGDTPARYHSTNRRKDFEFKVHAPGQTGDIETIGGAYPTFTVLAGRPLSSANGAFLPVSVLSATTSNKTDSNGDTDIADSTVSPQGSDLVKKIEGLRRVSDGNIQLVGKNLWETKHSGTAWHDGIGINDTFSIPAPAIGGEHIGTSASHVASNDWGHEETTKTWWERRAHTGRDAGRYDYGLGIGGGFSESHLFGSSNNHVMSIHANTTYQGVHVEKGGIYANNGIIAWARILPRGAYSQQRITADSALTAAGPITTAVVLDSHNISTFTDLAPGLFHLEIDPSFLPIGNTYSVIVTGTSNIGLNADLNSTEEMTTVRYAAAEFRKKSPESITEHDNRCVLDQAVASVGVPNEQNGGLTTHNVRVANNTDIIVESRTEFGRTWGSGGTIPGNALVDEDEVFVVIVGGINPVNFRG